ncbi:uncharacterized protein LOC120293707 [Eucalyptus grandis]|uniref:uncharacterized protein LOC120293707 n=1 Tax=Eucalyptus grandis TaxID=71139 RepID=UPI00192ED80B|nr:uncharacterized protein LOC120293707 [Eucalyptus grandis]
MRNSPWSYSTNLLVLKQCLPEVPEHCYEFTKAAFWVRIGGVPPGWRIDKVLTDLGKRMGNVLEVQLDSTNNVQNRGGRVRVKIDLTLPLKSGAILDIGNNWLWVEFKYERLPHYCFSCGRIGHYAIDCIEIPYATLPWAMNKKGLYGPWLKAETSDHNPYWDAFYGKMEEEFVVEETVPIPPTQPSGMNSIAREAASDMQIVACSKKRSKSSPEQDISPVNVPIVVEGEIVENECGTVNGRRRAAAGWAAGATRVRSRVAGWSAGVTDGDTANRLGIGWVASCRDSNRRWGSSDSSSRTGEWGSDGFKGMQAIERRQRRCWAPGTTLVQRQGGFADERRRAGEGNAGAVVGVESGLGNPLTIQELRALIALERPGLLFLMETKNKATMVEKICKKLQFQNLYLVNPTGIAGGLAIMWQEEIALKITFVHASTDFGERMTLWQLLGNLKPPISLPWICMGDFNEMLYVWEKVGKKEANNRRIAAFRNMLNDLSLMDVDSHGCAYTWANNREGADLVKKRLNRVLCTLEWRVTFHEAEVQALPAIGSDHSPLVLRRITRVKKRKKQFKLEAF